nr:DPH3 homolog isoform X2 [Anser cygnoides]
MRRRSPSARSRPARSGPAPSWRCSTTRWRSRTSSTTRRAEDLENGEDVATCPSCSLILRVIYDQEQFMRDEVIAEPVTNKELIKC